MNESHIRQRLEEILSAIQFLEELIAMGKDEFLADRRNIYAARHLIVQIIEASSDISEEIILQNALPLGEEAKTLYFQLYKLGIIPKSLATHFKKATGLRNLLVHQYWAIDDKKMYSDIGKGIKNFKEFINSITAYLLRK